MRFPWGDVADLPSVGDRIDTFADIRDELAAVAELHPLQKPWYQPAAYRDVPAEAFLPIEGSIVLGPGVAVVKTPGHVFGNQSLVINHITHASSL
ncbi:hypothetical protein APR12_000916 [Nocardia amikacinitolerans]|uniref:hypothetical protein n=1 Tax=Nocardia amikacinitolerans TaxID=756689 RepID=UPI000A51509E|nr:hypothetical protein [Nocardia amikacinitolerans]MCP2315583.1 hypothetical protein [Nocardia amikacinitolerans]